MVVMVTVVVIAVMMVVPAKEHPDGSCAIYGMVKPRYHMIK